MSPSSKVFSSFKIPSMLSVIECHRDEVCDGSLNKLNSQDIIAYGNNLMGCDVRNVLQVRELPPKAEVIGWSEKTGIEMFKYGDHMMGIQGHPEYTMDILLHLIDRLVQRNFIMVWTKN